jgi:hypothetical protein
MNAMGPFEVLSRRLENGIDFERKAQSLTTQHDREQYEEVANAVESPQM